MNFASRSVLPSAPQKLARRPAVTLALILALTTLSWGAAILQARGVFALRADVEKQEAVTAQLEARALQRAPAALGGAGLQDGTPVVLLLGETSALMAAEKQRVLAFIVENRGGRLRSAEIDEPVPVDADGGAGEAELFLVKTRLRIEIDEQALPDLLQDLEGENPFLRIDELALRAPRQIGDTSSPGLSAGSARILDVRIEVSGFWSPAGDEA
jgi:hypothetical protein